MSPPFELEDFDGGVASERARAEPDPQALEAARMEGYEAGYKSGWDDAAKAAEDDARSVGAELARNLRDLNFTYFEARDEVLGALKPFLSDLFDTLFPELLPEVASAAIANELADQVGAASSGIVRLLVAPDDVNVVRGLLAAESLENVDVMEESALASGQVRLTTDRREIVIDPEELLNRIRAELRGEDATVDCDPGELEMMKEAVGDGRV